MAEVVRTAEGGRGTAEAEGRNAEGRRRLTRRRRAQRRLRSHCRRRKEPRIVADGHGYDPGGEERKGSTVGNRAGDLGGGTADLAQRERRRIDEPTLRGSISSGIEPGHSAGKEQSGGGEQRDPPESSGEAHAGRLAERHEGAATRAADRSRASAPIVGDAGVGLGNLVDFMDSTPPRPSFGEHRVSRGLTQALPDLGVGIANSGLRHGVAFDLHAKLQRLSQFGILRIHAVVDDLDILGSRAAAGPAEVGFDGTGNRIGARIGPAAAAAELEGRRRSGRAHVAGLPDQSPNPVEGMRAALSGDRRTIRGVDRQGKRTGDEQGGDKLK